MKDQNRCGKTGYSCEEHKKYGSMFPDCCVDECGKYSYCKHCTKLPLYTGTSKVENNEKEN